MPPSSRAQQAMPTRSSQKCALQPSRLHKFTTHQSPVEFFFPISTSTTQHNRARTKEWEPEQQDLELALALAGIRTTRSRVLRAILTSDPAFGHPLLAALVNAVLLRLSANWAAASLLLWLLTAVLSFQIALCCINLHVSLVALLYHSAYCNCFARRVRRPRADADALTRLRRAFLSFAVPVLTLYNCAAWAALRQLDDPGKVPGGAAYVAGAGYVTVACQLACVVWALDDAWLFGGMRRSRALDPCTVFVFLFLFSESAFIFFPLSGCIGYGMVLRALVGGYERPLGLAFQLPFALCVELVIMLVTQPLVYRACKKPAHLGYVGELIGRLAGDNGVEL